MYEESSIDPIKYVVITLLLGLIILALFLLPLVPTKAQNKGSFAANIAGGTIQSAGLGGDSITPGTTSTSGTTQQSSSLLGGIFGGSSGPKFDSKVSIVNVKGQTAVYVIVDGKKHSIPTTEIFYSYGYKLDIVQEITQQELDKYPLARLFIVAGTEKDKNPQIYYLTDGRMLRPILNDRVFYSYGDRKEDVISINQKEFNYYPRNQFIYLERPKINRDIYQVTGGIKRYLTPVAVKRLNLQEKEIAPVNQTEFDEYPEGEPVIF